MTALPLPARLRARIPLPTSHLHLHARPHATHAAACQPTRHHTPPRTHCAPAHAPPPHARTRCAPHHAPPPHHTHHTCHCTHTTPAATTRGTHTSPPPAHTHTYLGGGLHLPLMRAERIAPRTRQAPAKSGIRRSWRTRHLWRGGETTAHSWHRDIRRALSSAYPQHHFCGIEGGSSALAAHVALVTQHPRVNRSSARSATHHEINITQSRRTYRRRLVCAS